MYILPFLSNRHSAPFLYSFINTNHLLLCQIIVGGSKKYRDYWPNFLDDTSLLVYIVDASNPSRFEESKKVLHGLLSEPKLHGVPVLMVTSKNDLSTAGSLTEVTSAFQVQEITKKSGSKWSAVSVQVNSNGETDGFIEAKAKILALCR